MSSQPETPEAIEPVTETAPANVVGIEQGRERRARDGAPRGKQDRPERSERREKRREAKAEEAARHSPDVLSEGEVADAAVAVADTAAVKQAIITAPIVNTATVSAKSVERLQSTYDGAQQVMFDKQDVTSAVAPLVRHLNTVTELLNESQTALGRATMERDLLKQKYAEATGVSVDDVVVSLPATGSAESRPTGDAKMVTLEGRAEPTPAKKSSKIGKVFETSGLLIKPEHSKEEIAKAARRRQMLAIVIFTAIGISLYIAQRNGKDVTGFSRDSLAELQYVGIFFNMFLMMWMMYRVVRVGGKGAKWLFPNADKTQARRRK